MASEWVKCGWASACSHGLVNELQEFGLVNGYGLLITIVCLQNPFSERHGVKGTTIGPFYALSPASPFSTILPNFLPTLPQSTIPSLFPHPFQHSLKTYHAISIKGLGPISWVFTGRTNNLHIKGIAKNGMMTGFPSHTIPSLAITSVISL